MRQKYFRIIILIIVLLLIVFRIPKSHVQAESDEQKLKRLTDEILMYEKEVERLGNEANTLSNLINQYNTQIKLAQLKIAQTEEKILLLGGRIDQLKDSLTALKEAYNERVVKTYKMSRFSEGYLLLISLTNISDAVSSFKYLQRIQQADISLLGRLERAENLYKQEKSTQELLQSDLEDQRNVLSSQKNAKTKLLEQTKNDEKKYQTLLSSAKTELEAIQAIIAGKGVEEMVRHVSEGEKIASIIDGVSCNSSGAHLHFIVSESRIAKSPFSYLKNEVNYENCSGTSCGSTDGDPFAPVGSWNWPINQNIKFYQGYGLTWAIKNSWVGRIYSFHNGIDINSDSNLDVKSVKAGNLYRGSYTGGNNCYLRYVRVDHDDSDIDTYYLHINYQ